jgi:hypothetical protein
MNRTGTVTCPCGCNHKFTVRWPDTPAPTALSTSTALAALRPTADVQADMDLAARITLYLARRVGAGAITVRALYRAMNRHADDVYTALRLLVRDQRVIMLAGPPPRVLLRGSTGAVAG